MTVINNILNFLVETYPNTAAVLAGCLIATQYLPRRSNYTLRVILSFVLLGVWMFFGKQAIDNMPMPSMIIPIIVFAGMYLFSGAAVMLWHQASWHQALFAVTVSYALQNLCERIIEIPMSIHPWFPRQVIIPLLVLSLLWYNRLCKRYRKKQSMYDFSSADNRILLFIAAGVMLVCVVLDLKLRHELENAGTQANIYISIIMIMFSFMSVVLCMSHLRETDNRVRADEATQLLRIEQRRFEYDKQIHDAINVKCHDIRHQINAMRYSSTDDAYRAELKKIGKLVDIYDTMPHSQNAALDVVLAGKMLTCNSRNITMTSMADGRRLSFMEDGDVYALFGNILDNAIDAANLVEDPEQRMITLTVETRGDFLVVECENYYSGKLTFEDGLPQTTKADQINHGYGTQSIRMLAEKYDGYMKVSASEDIFTLSVLIPIPAAA